MFFEKRGGAHPSWTPRLPLLQPHLTEPENTCTQQLSPTAAAAKKPPLGANPAVSPPDGSLTCLGWLQNLKVPDMFSPEVRIRLHPPSPCSEDGCSSWETVSSSSASPPGGKSDPFLSGTCRPPSPLHQCLVHSSQFKSAPKRYRSDSTKPPYSHTSLVYLALLHSRSGRASQHEICRWIKSNFKYYKEAEPGWQNSIRQCLAVTDLFVKAGRTNGESSRGCWTVHPHLREFLEKEQLPAGPRKLKRAYSYNGKDSRQGGRGRKRVTSEAQVPVDPCGLPGDLDWISLLSSQRVSCGSYGSPILGPPDLGQVGDPMICSPLIVPTSITTASLSSTPAPADPALEDNLKDGKELEDVFTTTNSPLPSPHLLPWAECQPESPSIHPWAESKETTLKSLGRQRQRSVIPAHNHSSWSPDVSCFSTSCSSSSSSISHQHSKSRTAERYIY